MITLIPVSVLCGLMTSFLFRHFAAADTRRTVNRIIAHCLEFRLFIDEPRVIFRAQRDLLRENLHLLRSIAVPALLAAPVVAIVIWQGEAIYGRAPLAANRPAIVTAHIDSGDLAAVRLEAPPQVSIETPGVRVARLHEVSWRIRPAVQFSGSLSVRPAGRLEIPWPRATLFGFSWIVWFCVISTISAVLGPRVWRRVVPLLFLAVAANAASAPVILISIDTLRADHLSAYGYTKNHTPFIDELAAKGTVYQHIDTQIPLTLPSHTTLFTSTYPFANRVEGNDENLPPDAVTLTSVLHANGYHTSAFVGSIILDRQYGLDKGFDEYDSPFRPAPGQLPNPYSTRIRRDAALVTRAAAQWIGENRAVPFFAFLHFYDLHTPYTLQAVASLTPNVAGYDAELEHIDQALEGFREALIREGVWDKALVILLADHGEGLGDHGETSHGYFIYESTMHVPLIVRWPAGESRAPSHVAEAGGLIDVAPTVLDFLHIAPPPAFCGATLLTARTDRVIYGESVYPRDTFGWAALRSIRSGAMKYIDAPKPELYDLAKDPDERVNLMAPQPADARLLKARLGDLERRIGTRSAVQSPPVSPATRELLGSLGYTAGGRQPQRNQAADPKDKLGEQEAYERGLTFLYTAHYERAIAAFQRVLAQDVANLPARCALGEAYFRSGNVARAIACWQQALEHDPKYRPAADSIAAACRLSPAVPECHHH